VVLKRDGLIRQGPDVAIGPPAELVEAESEGKFARGDGLLRPGIAQVVQSLHVFLDSRGPDDVEWDRSPALEVELQGQEYESEHMVRVKMRHEGARERVTAEVESAKVDPDGGRHVQEDLPVQDEAAPIPRHEQSRARAEDREVVKAMIHEALLILGLTVLVPLREEPSEEQFHESMPLTSHAPSGRRMHR